MAGSQSVPARGIASHQEGCCKGRGKSRSGATSEAPKSYGEVEQESAWNEADPDSCNNPTTLQACIGVRLYLSKYPAGSHADEARRVIDSAKPKMDLLQKDENYWTAESNFSGCAAYHSQNSCEGVELYVAKYPKGLHLGEATELLQVSGSR